MLLDQCLSEGSNEWRGRGNNSQLVIMLGCRQDIQAVWIKNGLKDYQSQNFIISVSTHPKGPWKQVLNDSLPVPSSKVTICMYVNYLKRDCSGG